MSHWCLPLNSVADHEYMASQPGANRDGVETLGTAAPRSTGCLGLS
jgi:hypothetical protein